MLCPGWIPVLPIVLPQLHHSLVPIRSDTVAKKLGMPSRNRRRVAAAAVAGCRRRGAELLLTFTEVCGTFTLGSIGA